MRIGIAAPIVTKPLLKFLSDREAPKVPSGMGGYTIVPLVAELLHQGHQVAVYSLDFGVEEPIVLHGDRLTVYYGAYRSHHRMRDMMLQERAAVSQFISTDKPDIVHANWTYEYALGALASGVPTVITVRDWPWRVFLLKRDLYRLGKLAMHFQTLHRGSHFTAVSPYIRGTLRMFGVSAPVIPNGLQCETFSARRHCLDASTPTIISINSGFGKLKNVKTLLQAFRLVKEELPGARLLLIGDGYEHGGEAHAWALAEGLNHGVDFVGHLDNDGALAMLERSDLLIHPSLEESFGMTLIEAMSKAVPVIGGASSGAVPWVLDCGRAGMLVDPRSPVQIATAAVRVLTSEAVWERYSLAGFSRASAVYSMSAVGELYLDRYRAAVAPQGSSRSCRDRC